MISFTYLNKKNSNHFFSSPNPLFFKILIIIFSFGFIEAVSAQTYTLTSGTSWTVPPGIVKVRVECWGAGGGGAYRTSTGGGGGGGGGAYATLELCVTPGGSISYAVGLGGSGTSGTNHGGDTWFSSSATVLAQGGRGAADNSSTGAAGGTVAASFGTVRYAGGNGGEGYSSSFWGRLGGGGGGAARTTGGGNNGGDAAWAGTGGGGSSTAPGGAGGNGSDNNDGNNGNNYGGGGGGSGRNSGNRNGGNGASGLIRITVLNTYTLDAGPDAITASAGNNVTLNGIAGPIPGISYTQDFNGCNAVTCNNWILNGGAANGITATAANGYTSCSNSSAKSNIYNLYPWVELISNASLGTSNGEPITLSFNAKCINYSNGNAAAAGACTFSGYWSTNGSTWTLIGTGINNISSTSCNTYTLPTFSAPAGSNVYILIGADRNSGDFWAVFDDISLTQPSLIPVISWSGGPIVSGGTTTTPTVNPDYTTIYTISTTIAGCTVTDNATVTVTSPLAITLASFNAKCNDAKIDIRWRTDAEFNSDYFTLERSRDGIIWELVTTISANGSDNTISTYQATDITATEVYYRLKETDLDGKSEYHGPIVVNCDNSSNELIVYPNPNNGKFTVAVNTQEAIGDATIFVQDVTGKTVVSQNINILSGTNTVYFENTNLIRGTYIVSILGKDKSTFTPVKLVIQ